MNSSGIISTPSEKLSKAPETINHVKDAVADKLKLSADAVESTSNKIADQQATVREYGQQVAGKLRQSADYVGELDARVVGTQITHGLRRHVGASLLVAGAAGLLVGLLVRR